MSTESLMSKCEKTGAPTPGNLRSKLRTLGWFLARPALYREMVRKLGRAEFSTARSHQKTESERAAGLAWCREQAISVEAFCQQVGVPSPLTPFSEAESGAWQSALKAMEQCPVSMGGPGHLDLLYHLVRHKKPKRVLETGVAYGWSSLAILSALESIQAGHLWSVDMPYVGLGNDRYVGCVVPSPLRRRWTLVRKPDRDGLPEIFQKATDFDLVHYDSDKSERGRAFAYPLLWKHLRSGGFFITDDPEDNLGFRDFAANVGATVYVVEKWTDTYVGVLTKP